MVRAAALCAVVAGAMAVAQDLRNVTEPHYPAVCTVLEAALSAAGGGLSEADERRPDTQRIQKAIDECAPGQAVQLTAGAGKDVFLTGPILLKPGVTLLIGPGATLLASRDARDYDLTPGSCGVVNEKGHGCKPVILADHAAGSGIMGEGIIDGRGGAKISGQNVSWWDLAQEAKVKELSQSVPRLVVARQSDDFTLYRITLRNSPNFHVLVERANGFTAWGVKIRAPRTARNTDGIDPSSSTNVTIAHCDIAAGDDNVAIKAGSAGPAAHVSILHNHFYSGHGMSIGSETNGGVEAIRVSDLSIDGADNGIRIKSDRSRGGLVHDVQYEDVCMRDVKNPIVLTMMYSSRSGDKLPVYRDIRLKNVHSETPGWVTYLGLDASHKVQVTLDQVAIDGQRQDRTRVENADITVKSGEGGALACNGRFRILR